MRTQGSEDHYTDDRQCRLSASLNVILFAAVRVSGDGESTSTVTGGSESLKWNAENA